MRTIRLRLARVVGASVDGLTSLGGPSQPRLAVFGESTLVRNFLLDASLSG